MPLTQSIASFSKTSVPSNRFIAPFMAHGRCDGTTTLHNYYTFYGVYFLNSPKTISTAKFEIVTAMANTGTPIIQLAFYNPANVNGEVRIGTQIPNSLATGIDAATTGVKTVTFATPWQTPRGIFFMGLKPTGSISNQSGTIRSFNINSGTNDYIWAQFMGGFSSATPTAQYGTPAFPIPSSYGQSTNLLADFTSTSIDYEATGARTQPAVMIG